MILMYLFELYSINQYHICVFSVTSAFVMSEQNKQSELTVKQWLKDIKLVRYEQIFDENGYDEMTFVYNLDEDALTKMGINKMCDRTQILKSINSLSGSIISLIQNVLYVVYFMLK